MFEVQSRSMRSARYWHSLANQIDMEPEYQRRGGIWSEEDQRFLIDSILNDYDIPKLYFADFTSISSSLNSDRKRFAVIDGKQRIEALFRFLDNNLALSEKTQWLDNPHVSIRGLYYRDLQKLHPELATKVTEYPMPIMHVITDEFDRINELFVRLNKGANLTGAEKRNAMIGPIPKIVRRISNHKFFTDCVRYKANRGQNLNAAAKLLRFELLGGPVDTKKAQLDAMTRNYETWNPADLNAAETRVVHTLDRMIEVFNPDDPLLSSQGTIPVYYWLIRNADSVGAHIREFLLTFERELRETRKADGRSADLVTYDNAMRSTNDGWSHEQRYLTLLSRLELVDAEL